MYLSFKILFILREGERAGQGQRERGRERILSRLHTVGTELDVELEPTDP